MNRKRANTLLLFGLLSFLVAGYSPRSLAGPAWIEKKQDLFESAVTAVAEPYIGLSSKAAATGAGGVVLDNSHLFHLIYREAAQSAGMHYLGYAPMGKLLERMGPVARPDIRVGDLVVLNSGLAAMIYKFDSEGKFYLIYVSRKRQRVVSFNSGNVVSDVYWMKNLKGFYRLSRYNFSPEP